MRTLDPARATGGGGATQRVAPRPFLFVICGFLWFHVVVTIANNRDAIESSLGQGSLPPEYQTYIIYALTALLALSVVALLMHVGRILARSRTKRANSTALLGGAAMAVGLIYMPSSVLDVGIELLDDNSRTLLQMASNTVRDTVPGVDFGSITLVSSYGQ